MTNTSKKLDTGWYSWLMENLAMAVHPEKIKEKMIQSGFAPEEADEALAGVGQSPLFKPYQSLFLKKQKMEALLDLDHTFKAAQGFYAGVDQLDDLDAKGFFDNYFFRNRPVLVRGWTKHWAAREKWTLDFFRDNFGDETVEIACNRSQSQRYEIEFNKFLKKIRFREYIDLIKETPESNDFYLVARNFLLKNPRFQPLFQDFAPVDGVLDPAGHDAAGFIKLWLGPKGTISKLHHDRVNVLLVQVMGRKLVRFIPPNQLHKVYNNTYVYGDIDLDAPIDLQRYPKARDLAISEVIVHPGDALLIPVGWWHWVKSLDISLTLTHQKFAIPGGNVFLRDNFKD